MGTISIKYNKKPSVVDAFKMDMSLPIIDFNVEHVEGKEYDLNFFDFMFSADQVLHMCWFNLAQLKEGSSRGG